MLQPVIGGGFAANKKGVLSIRINVNRTKKSLTWPKEKKKVKKEHAYNVTKH